MTPAIPAVNEQSVNATVRIIRRFTPARRAASALPPIAYTYRPNRVRPRTKVHAARMPNTNRTTHGTPRIGRIRPRSVLQMSTMTTPPTRPPPIFSAVSPGGGATRPAVRRRASRRHVSTPNSPTMTSITTQPAIGLRLPLAMSFTMESLISTDPPFPRIFSVRPSQKSNPASVTTNEGRPRRVMMEPCRTPIAAQTSRATRIAAHHGQSSPEGLSSSASTTPPRAATNPIDRSISPSSKA
jgi:hypothetical protein